MYLSISANEIKSFKLWFGVCAVVGSHLLASSIVSIYLPPHNKTKKVYF